MSPKESSLAFEEVGEISLIRDPELRLIESRYRNTNSLSQVFTSDENADVMMIEGRITVSF